MVVGHQKILPDLQHEGLKYFQIYIKKGLKEKQLEWFDFKKYFKKQYLSESYYERKTKEFRELQLGLMTMEDLINKFLELLRFISYIHEDKVKIQ